MKITRRKMLLPYLFIGLLLTKGVSAYNDKTVEITELLVPASPRDGDDVTLTCQFHLGGFNHKLYTVNWWRGKDQFYTYRGSIYDPKTSFTFPGIKVNKEESSNVSVVLNNVSEETSGIFKCEVMGEGPTFKTAVETKSMDVVVPPKSVEIRSWAHPDQTVYRVGDTVQMNCTAKGAKPRAMLTWEINGRKVRELDVLRYPDFEDHRGRITSSTAIRWMAPEYFQGNQAKVACVADVKGHRKIASKDIYLDPASSAAFNHQYASSGYKPSTTRTILILTFIFMSGIYL